MIAYLNTVTDILVVNLGLNGIQDWCSLVPRLTAMWNKIIVVHV